MRMRIPYAYANSYLCARVRVIVNLGMLLCTKMIVCVCLSPFDHVRVAKTSWARMLGVSCFKSNTRHNLEDRLEVSVEAFEPPCKMNARFAVFRVNAGILS